MARPTRLRQVQRELAPGTPLREGLDRIQYGRTGALIVLGHNHQVDDVSSGGFRLNVEFSPQALRELAKMDGAIIVSSDLNRIVAAAVQLVPPGGLPTAETGTRHRSADRTAQATGVPCITVSASMSTISLFMDGRRYVVESPERTLSRANQTLATLSRYVTRLHDHLRFFDALEISHQVTLRSLLNVINSYEMTRRLSSETSFHIDMLGADARHVELQHTELISPYAELADLLALDYAHNAETPAAFDLERLSNFSAEELDTPTLIASSLGFGAEPALETPVTPKGLRLLTSVGHLPLKLSQQVLRDHSLQELFGASIASLTEIDQIGPDQARLVRDALARIVAA